MKVSKEVRNISIVIVNFNAGEFLLDCLTSLNKSSADINLQVWVVDNDSTDDSLEKAQKKFPQFHYIKNEENLGYGKANNIALKKINSEYILLLNPDTTVTSETLITMLNFMIDNPGVGAATCKVQKLDGSIDWASHRGFPTPFAALKYFLLKDDSLYHLTNQDLTKTHQVDAIAGAFFMTRKSVLEKTGLFDEDYFMYAEDIDLCFRIKQAGFKVMYVPMVSILHHKGAISGIKKHSQDISQSDIKSRKRALDSFYETMKIFYKKHYEKQNFFLINWLVYLAIDIKWFLAKLKMNV